MSKRAEWTWGYTAAEVLPYAERKEAHHAVRVAHWTRAWEKAQEVANKYQRRGLRDIPPSGMHAHTFSASDFPPELQEASNRAHAAASKVQVHRTAQEEAAKYVRALRVDPNNVLALTVDDLDYFGIGHTADEPDPEA